MNITITIQTDNAAFENFEGAEVARILDGLADRLRKRCDLCATTNLPLYDNNGNNVGSFTVDDESEASP